MNQWIRLLKVTGSKKVSENEIRGLFGELVVLLNYMIPKYGSNRAVRSWTGAEQTKKDFSIDDTWYEVKTLSMGKATVTITSIEQLDSEIEGFLTVVKVEKMSKEYNGISLQDLIEEIIKILNQNEQDIFINKLSEFGYDFFDDYSAYVYKIEETNFYVVDNKFPRILRQSLPVEVINCTYDLDLILLTDYLVEEI
jgi:hypothetical protein